MNSHYLWFTRNISLKFLWITTNYSVQKQLRLCERLIFQWLQTYYSCVNDVKCYTWQTIGINCSSNKRSWFFPIFTMYHILQISELFESEFWIVDHFDNSLFIRVIRNSPGWIATNFAVLQIKRPKQVDLLA